MGSDGDHQQCVGARRVAVVFSNVSWALGAIIQFHRAHFGLGSITSAIHASAGGHIATLCCQMLSAFLESDFVAINENFIGLDEQVASAASATASSAAQGSFDESVRVMALDTALLVLQTLGTTLYWIPHARERVSKNEEFVARLISLADDSTTTAPVAAGEQQISGEGPKTQGAPTDQDKGEAGHEEPGAIAALETIQFASIPKKILIMRRTIAKVLELIDTLPPAQPDVESGTGSSSTASGGKSAGALSPASSGAGADDASHFASMPMGPVSGSSSK